MEKNVHEKIDILSKLTALALIAVGINQITKLNFYQGTLLIIMGGLVSITPFFIKKE